MAPVTFHGGECPAGDAFGVGFSSVREALRSWGIACQEDLSQWLRRQGFPAVRPGNHVSQGTRAHPHCWSCIAADVALLDAVCVLTAAAESSFHLRLVSRQEKGRETGGADGTWEQIDDVHLHEVCLLRILTLKSCPTRRRFQTNKLQSFEAALSFSGPEDSGARAELEAALTRARGH